MPGPFLRLLIHRGVVLIHLTRWVMVFNVTFNNI